MQQRSRHYPHRTHCTFLIESKFGVNQRTKQAEALPERAASPLFLWLHVKCEVEIPKKLNKAQRDALKKFEGTLKEENYEKRKGFFKKLKDMFNA